MTFQDVNVTKSNLLLGDGRMIFKRSVLFGSTIMQEYMRNVVIGEVRKPFPENRNKNI